MREAYVVADNILSPLGQTTAENFRRLRNKESGISLHHNPRIWADPFYASLFKTRPGLQADEKYSPFESLLIQSISEALRGSAISLAEKRTLLIISTTKGNISMLESGGTGEEFERSISLPASAAKIAGYFQAANQPVIVSHACISGLLAIITALRLVKSSAYDQVVVAGADLITQFIFSGFQSFQAISASPCRPFDAARNGVSLGEGAATVIISSTPGKSAPIRLAGGATSNDANHISGPSRTGEELALAIGQAMRQSGLAAKDIDIICAHGTATVYNDEMEARAFHLAGLAEKPVNSLKGNYGHTLGAAGLIETVISIHSMQEGIFMPTAGYRDSGTSKVLRVSGEALSGRFPVCLKTASGFGGCNAALVLRGD